MADRALLLKPPKSERRTPQQLREQYEIETALAERLRTAPPHERRRLYGALRAELYQRVLHHPQLTQKAFPTCAAASAATQLGFLRPFLRPDVTFLEIGPGDCALSFAVAQLVNRVDAVGVSGEITRTAAAPSNFALLLSDGCSIPVPRGSVGVAYSHQLMEHLHPDDALEQLRNVFAALVPGGRYVCVTPNRLGGPWDISMYFDTVATGFHLKEYTLTELATLFREVGFRELRAYVGARTSYVGVAPPLIGLCERVLDALPFALRRPLARSAPMRSLLGIRLVGRK